ncbi:hypothetical protein A5823_002828 [Enterococcus faecalis]|uniref:hypothetical protein n=1 Tax=Enterococcus faecalis TaxID=1351 RepID=UPI000A32B4FF|nr:hypothetical protein [Enterococcus faecalis]OTP25072.1 hypothetical protein A5823_002828 [Enterococcus faecalis]
MELFASISSMVAFILAIILLFNIRKLGEISDFLKWVGLFLCLAVLGANILNLIDFFHGFIDGFKSQY